MAKLIPRLVHWIWKRRFDCIYKLGGKVVGARALVFQNDHVLLVHHTYIDGWYTIGGMVDRHETPLAAIKRELMEEAGIQVLADPELFAVYYALNNKKDDYIFFYIVKKFRQVSYQSQEIEDCRFFPLNALPEGISEATKRRIEEYLGLRAVMEEW